MRNVGSQFVSNPFQVLGTSDTEPKEATKATEVTEPKVSLTSPSAPPKIQVVSLTEPVSQPTEATDMNFETLGIMLAISALNTYVKNPKTNAKVNAELATACADVLTDMGYTVTAPATAPATPPTQAA